jgi:RNA-binding protein
MLKLNSAQRAELKRLAHHLDPVVLIGKQGVGDMQVRAAADALEAHELIKVKFNEFKDEKAALIEEITARTGSLLVGLIGHVAILYKRQSDPAKRRIGI